MGVMSGATMNVHIPLSDPEETVGNEPRLSILVAIITIVATTALVAANTQFATDSLESLTDRSVSASFVGVAILPLLSLNLGVINYPIDDKMGLAVSLTLNQCLQVALLVIPFTVLLAWWMGIETMSLEFDAFTTVSLFIAMIVLEYVVQEGKSN
ncbi:hypothetical protein BJX64DRAFT_84846 [Aspergillus heterothallicus]